MLSYNIKALSSHKLQSCSTGQDPIWVDQLNSTMLLNSLWTTDNLDSHSKT